MEWGAGFGIALVLVMLLPIRGSNQRVFATQVGKNEKLPGIGGTAAEKVDVLMNRQGYFQVC